VKALQRKFVTKIIVFCW